MENYDHKKIEKKWREKWFKDKIYEPDMDLAKKPYYNLMMFPYPSAEGLHVGNMYAFTGSDIWGRFMNMNGYDVFEPIGLDGFGIHSENYAIKIGEHIRDVSRRTEANFYRQLNMIGNRFSWQRRVETYNPNYYKWTQWLFIQMYKHDLAYRKKAMVNWCPSCKTVLSDEQVEGGACERCKTKTTMKEMEQWFWKITKYAEKLLKNLEWLDWSEDVKIGQKNWVGKSEGINIHYDVVGLNEKVVCFTTRPDTNFGATFLVAAPDSEFVKRNLNKFPNKDLVKKYIKESSRKTELERISEKRKKTGVETGLFAINNLNGYKMPIFIGDFVLGSVGTGVVVGVPGHDKRDFEFAMEFNIPVKNVVSLNGEMIGYVKRQWSRDFNSFVIGLKSLGAKFVSQSKDDVLYIINEKSLDKWIRLCQKSVLKDSWHDILGDIYVMVAYSDKVYKLKKFEDDRDGIFEVQKQLEKSVRKYKNIWEMLYNSQYRDFVVQEDKGTIINSDFLNGLDIHKATIRIMDYIEKKGFGERAINYKLRDWCVSRQRYWGAPIPMIKCKKCGWQPVSEDELPVLLPEIPNFSDILPDGSGKGPLARKKNFVNTLCPKCKGPAKRETDVMDPFVDSCWYHFRYPSTDFSYEPFNKERTKKWLPVNMYIGGKEHTVLHLLYSRFVCMALKDFGYIDFEEPFARFFRHGLLIKEGAKMSKSKGNVINPDEYIDKYGADSVRLYLMFLGNFEQGGDWRDKGMNGMSRFVKKVWKLSTNQVKDGNGVKDMSMIHKTIYMVEKDIKRLSYNTAISKIMEFVNWYSDNEKLFTKGQRKKCIETLALCLAPFAPFITEEIWERLGNKYSIHEQPWPKYDKKCIKSQEITIAVQINGKLRDTILIQTGTSEKEVYEIAIKRPRVQKYVKKGIKKAIFVKDKIINFVV